MSIFQSDLQKRTKQRRARLKNNIRGKAWQGEEEYYGGELTMNFPKKKYTIHDNCLTESLETKHSEAVLDSSAQRELADILEQEIIALDVFLENHHYGNLSNQELYNETGKTFGEIKKIIKFIRGGGE